MACPSDPRPRGRPHLPRRGLRRRGRDLRRGGLQHRHDRLPGDAHRPVVPPPGRRDDRAAHRQHRHERRGPRVARGSGWPATSSATPPGCRRSWRSRRSLDDELRAQGVVGISGIDTRALTRHLRERGAMRVGISSTETDPAVLLERVRGAGRRWPGAELAGEVSTGETYVVPAHRREAAHRRRARPGHQGDDPAPDGRARHRGARAAGHRDHRRRAGDRRRRAVLLQRSGRPGGHDLPGRAAAGGAGRRDAPTSASASATSCSAGRSASAPTSSSTATAASTSRSWTAPPARSR